MCFRFNPLPNKPLFLCVCSASLLKKVWELEKLLVTSNFSFSHSVFYLFRELSAIFIKSEIVVCKLSQFGRVWNVSFGKGLKNLFLIINGDVRICLNFSTVSSQVQRAFGVAQSRVYRTGERVQIPSFLLAGLFLEKTPGTCIAIELTLSLLSSSCKKSATFCPISAITDHIYLKLKIYVHYKKGNMYKQER